MNIWNKCNYLLSFYNKESLKEFGHKTVDLFKENKAARNDKPDTKAAIVDPPKVNYYDLNKYYNCNETISFNTLIADGMTRNSAKPTNNIGHRALESVNIYYY